MTRKNTHIEIVRSETMGLSSMSKKSCDSIFAVLAEHFTNVGVTIVNNYADLEALVASQPDLVFLGMESLPFDAALGAADTRRVWLSDVLDKHEIAYTGSNRIAQERGRNKPLAKQCVQKAKLKTSAFCVIRKNQALAPSDVPLEFPLFVKPTSRGGGSGIDGSSVVHNFEQLCSKVHSLTSQFHSDVLVETYLPGREFSVAILKDTDSTELLALPLELIAPLDNNGSRLLSNEIKSSNAEEALEVRHSAIKSNVSALALAVFGALGARDYGRIDIRLDSRGTPHFLEANLIPSLISNYGSFPKACVLNIGLKYEPMILRLVELGLARKTARGVEISKPAQLRKSSHTPPAVVFDPI